MDDALIVAIIGGIMSVAVAIITVRYTMKMKANEMMKTTVYPKLYDWFSTRVSNFLFDDELVNASTFKSTIPPSEYLKLDKKIKEKVDEFVNEGQKWDYMWNQVENRFTRRDTKIFEHLIHPLKKSNLLNDQNRIQTKEGGFTIDAFLDPFFSALIDPSIKNAEDLYQKMKECAEKKNLYRELEYLEDIKREIPQFFEFINEGLSSLRNDVLLDITYDDLMGQAKKAKQIRSALMDSLGNKFKK